MSFWIPNPELNKEFMQKRESMYDNLYFSVFSSENTYVFYKTCFSKCVTDFTTNNLNYLERDCLRECNIQGNNVQRNLLGSYSILM